MRRRWDSLSTEAKVAAVGAIVMPIVVALFAGVVLPMLNRHITPPPPAPERDGIVKVVEVEPNLRLGDYVAQYASATPRPQDYVLASQEVRDTVKPPEDDTVKPPDDDTVKPPDDDTVKPPDDDTVKPPDDDGTQPPTCRLVGCTEKPAGQIPAEVKPVSKCADESDCDGDGFRDGADMCPSYPGRHNGCGLAQVKTQEYGCSEDEMNETLTAGDADTTRCEDLNESVLGPTTDGKPGDVKRRAERVAAALHETQTTRPREGGRLEPVGVGVTIRFTVTGMKGEHLEARWSLRHAGGRRIPQRWLKNRGFLKLTPDALKDSGTQPFWVPLPKSPKGPYFVRVELRDEHGTTLAVARTHRIG